MSVPYPSIDDVHAAAERIRGRVVRTPLRHSPGLSDATGRRVYHKIEAMQHTGAFKLRGAFNALMTLNDEARRRGVITFSSGNHGRGIAYAAKDQGIDAMVCVSAGVPAVKVDAIRALGADVRVTGATQDEAEAGMMDLVAETGRVLVSPFDDAAVIAGQGTISMEILQDCPDVDSIIVPLSGGGLIAGIALAAKALKPSVRVVGVTMEQGAAMHESLKAGHVVDIVESPTLADALQGGLGADNRLSFPMVRDLVDDSVLVSEDEIADAMAWLYWNDRLIAEGGGATGTAALLTNRIGDLGDVVVNVLSGCNVDMATFSAICAERKP